MGPPNLLFLLTDERHADTLGAYRNPSMQTPNPERLATQSTPMDSLPRLN